LKLSPAEKEVEKEISTANMSLETKVTPGEPNDTINIHGPKTFVIAAKEYILSESAKLANCDKLTFNVFEALSAEALETIAVNGTDKDQLLSRIIGKDGRALKRIMSDHGVTVSFSNQNNAELGTATIEGLKENVNAAKEAVIRSLESDVRSH
jgi:ATPase subunit of ABC transporter with duplicated ATPase domains